MTVSIVAVDVGNSAIKLQAFQRQPPQQDHPPAVARQPIAVRYDQSDWAEAIMQLRGLLATAAPTPVGEPGSSRSDGDDGASPVVWRVVSVNLPGSDRLRQLVLQRFPSDVWRMITWRDIPLRIDVHQPQVVGIDRLVGGWAAWRRTGGDVVVVDAGSAVTVDLVARGGIFRGGAILPGLGLQYRALAAGTAALPDLSRWQAPVVGTSPEALFDGPGRDTAEAIRLGITAGIVSGIARLAAIYRTSTQGDQPLPMVLTGGDALRLAPLLPPPLQVVPGLVVEGLAELPIDTV